MTLSDTDTEGQSRLINVLKKCEMKLDKLEGVQYKRIVSGHSESCLRSVGHMTKELLKLVSWKNIENSCKIS